MQEENLICYFLRSQKPMFSIAIKTFVAWSLTRYLNTLELIADKHSIMWTWQESGKRCCKYL